MGLASEMISSETTEADKDKSKLMSELVDLPSRDQWRKLAKNVQGCFNLLWIIVDGLLLCRS